MPRTKRVPVAVALSLFALLLAPATAYAGGDVNFLIGGKPFMNDDWDPVANQGTFGVEVTFGRETWPVWIAIDSFGADKIARNVTFDFEGTLYTHDIYGSTGEFDLGVRKIWGNHKTRPFIGGGVGLISAEIDLGVPSDSADKVGPWVGGGVFWRLGSRFNLGVTTRWSDANVTVFGSDLQAGGFTGGVLIGWGWPAYF